MHNQFLGNEAVHEAAKISMRPPYALHLAAPISFKKSRMGTAERIAWFATFVLLTVPITRPHNHHYLVRTSKQHKNYQKEIEKHVWKYTLQPFASLSNDSTDLN